MKKILSLFIIIFSLNIFASKFDNDKSVPTSWYIQEGEEEGYEKKIKEILNRGGYISVLNNKKITFKEYLCEVGVLVVDIAYSERYGRNFAIINPDFYSPISFKRDFVCKAINDEEILFEAPGVGFTGIINMDTGTTYIFNPNSRYYLNDLEVSKRESITLEEAAEYCREIVKENPEYIREIYKAEERYKKRSGYNSRIMY